MQHPSLLRRLASMFYEAWLILALWFVVNACLIGLRVLTASSKLEHGSLALSGLWLDALFFLMLLTVVVFYSYFWLKSGQTLAMQAWKIKLVSTNGSPLTLKHCLIRIFVSWISLACLGLGYIWCIWDKDKQTWHDKLSQTRLCLIPKT